MKRQGPSVRSIVLAAGLGMLAAGRMAVAADLPLKAAARQRVYDWTGFYVGGQFGAGGGSLGPGSNVLPLQGVLLPHSVTGLTGGFQVGYNQEFANHVVLGLEGSASFPGPLDAPANGRMPTPAFNTTLDYVGTLRGRLGYAGIGDGRWMPYVTGGFAWGHSHLLINDSESELRRTHWGWTAGLGLAFAVSGNWTARFEYDYVDLARQAYDLSAFGLPPVAIDPRIHLATIGLNYQFGDLSAPVISEAAKPRLPESELWNVHAQTTFLPQGYPSFRSPYQGTNSLPGPGQVQATWTATAFLGVKLWEGGEFYLDPEMTQGFGLNGTLGLAGFPNGEAQKAGAAYPRVRPQRYFLKQTWGLGGEQEDVPDGANQLAGKRDIDRVTLVVGRFAIGDFFDNNAYAHDPRADFMNWALWESAAYDFPADLPGFTRGVYAELNRAEWAVRGAYVEVPSEPNSDLLQFKTGGAVVEFEERHTLGGQPGKVRVGGFENQGVTGNYNEALAIAAADPLLDINGVMASIRRVRLKYGFYANLEQQIVQDVGLFARVSWNDGQNEILSFTDIDRSLAGGVSIKGSHWGRDNDTIGIGGAINGLSKPHRDYLAAGGLGLLIGDGRLNYRPEQILEAYYAYQVSKNFTATADYQFIANPAYNADRGPVSIFSCRLHAEF